MGGGTNLTMELYGLDNVINVMACTEQYQFCIPSPNAASLCTPFTSANDLLYQPFVDPLLQKIHASDYQTAIIESLILALQYSGFRHLIPTMNSPLLAEDLVSTRVSLPIASDQWVLESKNWFSLGLTNMQYMGVDYVSGPPAEYSQYATTPGNNTGLNWLCQNQIVRSGDYMNFSILSIFLVFILGRLVIFVSLWLETAVGLIRSRLRLERWKQTAWWAEGILQLQRQAFEGKGIRGWEVKEWDQVPLTEEEKSFTGLGSYDEMVPFDAAQTMELQSTFPMARFEKGAVVREFSVASSKEGIRDLKRLRSNSF
jgi:hypothetical protein